jgi:death-on-curing protein
VRDPTFLTLDEALALHGDQIRRYGGRSGVRDVGLLQSAIEKPKVTHSGEHLHTDLFEMAAAYLFHIIRNHPSVDGHKRTALMAALAFLGLNGLQLDAESEELLELVMGTASGDVTKAGVAVFLQEHSRPRPG